VTANRILIGRVCVLAVAQLAVGLAFADVRLPRLISDGMVLQRDVTTRIWGWADDGERVEVYLDGVRAGVATAGTGKWQLDLDAQPAGGPHTFMVVANNRLQVDDVYFGDVWVASGQSNMELTMDRVKYKYPEIVASADYPLIREFRVPRKYKFDAPADDFDSGQWRATTPETILDSSAVAFFFARAIRESEGVPIGIICSAYGGSAAESWMSEDALEAYPHYLKTARRYRDDDYLQSLLDADASAVDAWYAELDRNDKGLHSSPLWAASALDDSGWRQTPVPGLWSDTEFGPVVGAIWLRRTIELPDTVEGKGGRLFLGRIDDADTTYINGSKVGNVTYQYPPRIYDIAPGVLRPGSNLIAVRVINNGGNGGFIEDKTYELDVGDQIVDLGGAWRYKVGATSKPLASPTFVSYQQPLGFYNAMLAPLQNFRIKGVIWYQGESNVGRADEYAELFPAMIEDWREMWQQENLPFIFVQLANYLESSDEPGDSDWAELREAQRQALELPNTAMAVAIDVGEWNDIHPLDKKSVGERLALAARSLAYGDNQLVYSGPLFSELHRARNRLVVEFDHVGSGLAVHGDRLQGFAVAGADGRYVWAEARLKGNQAEVWNDTVENPVFVRYAWADNPDTANLYNEEGLPASPFQAHADPKP
jgi:sialate O-acetylesterase